MSEGNRRRRTSYDERILLICVSASDQPRVEELPEGAQEAAREVGERLAKTERVQDGAVAIHAIRPPERYP